MANQPRQAWENRAAPAVQRRNAQGVHEGSSHKPEEFMRDQPPAERQGKTGSDSPQDRNPTGRNEGDKRDT